MWWSFLTSLLLVTLASCHDHGVYLVRGSRSPMHTDDAPGTETPPLPPLQDEKPAVKPTMKFLHITSDIKYRYATTLVSTRIINPANQSGEATFTVILPEAAFISEFLMEVKDKVYKAYIKEKEEAKAIYQQAVHAGQFAGHVAQDARNSNQFTVSVNVEALGKVTFNLTYEQLLARNLGVYSNAININPQQIVEDMSVTVNIEEPTAIVDLEVPELQLSNEAVPEKSNEYAKIEEKSPNHKRVTWTPTPEEQKSKNIEGLSGQFIVKYDVNRKENPQQVLVDEGYFVHFFAPENLPKLRKHVVFVLDFSGSMAGKKLEQLRDAMKQIFSDLGPKDYFSIVIFQSWIDAWSPSKVISKQPLHGGYDGEFLQQSVHWRKLDFNGILDSKFVVGATPENIELAQAFLGNFTDLGGTNIMGGLRTGLQLVSIGEEMWVNESDPPRPVMVFLTDGLPNIEESDTDVIITKTKELNSKQCSIFSLAFGYEADFKFLRKLSLQNSGFARNIYEAADATQQLKNFYTAIASPLLSNVTFTYLPGQVDNSSSTKQEFPVFFSGSELVVAGKVNQENIANKKPIGELQGVGATGPQTYPIIIDRVITKPQKQATGHLERAWSYLTIQQLLDKADSLDDGEVKNQTRKKALDLALKYAFVTPLTSLVVVKPNETESTVDTTKVRPGSSTYPGMGILTTTRPSVAGFARPSYTSLPRPMYSFTHPPHYASTPITAIQPPPRKVSVHDVQWVQQALNATDSNRTVTVEGISYKLGINETDTTFGDCQVNMSSGECHHFQYCPLDVFEDDISQFISYKCLIPGDYLGVCCPVGIL